MRKEELKEIIVEECQKGAKDPYYKGKCFVSGINFKRIANNILIRLPDELYNKMSGCEVVGCHYYKDDICTYKDDICLYREETGGIK